MSDGWPFWVSISSPTCVVTAGLVHGAEALFKTKPSEGRKRKTVDTFCGKRGKRLALETVDSDGTVVGHISVAWPPYVAECEEQGRKRCPECFALAPGKPQPMNPEPYKPKRKKVSA